MIPGNKVDTRTALTRIAYPNSLKEVGLEDMEIGGIGIEDASQGLQGYIWTAVANPASGDVTLQRNGLEPVTWHNIGAGSSDLALAFNQNMQPVIAWRSYEGEIFLRYFSVESNTYTTVSIGLGSFPRLTLDDKRPNMNTTSDVIFAYMIGSSLRYRQQRDAFLIERILVADVSPATVFRRMGMGGLQLQFELT
jgi:hypothetical protein